MPCVAGGQGEGASASDYQQLVELGVQQVTMSSSVIEEPCSASSAASAGLMATCADNPADRQSPAERDANALNFLKPVSEPVRTSLSYLLI